MHPTNKARINAAALLCLLFTASSATAVTFDLAPPPATYVSQQYAGGWYGAVGPRRSFIFEDVSPFQLASVDIEINPIQTTTFTASLYAVIGVDTPGSQLASNSVILSDLGRGFYNTPLSYSFPGTGSRYLLDIFWNTDPEEAVFYQFEGLGDGSEPIDPPYVQGPVRIIDGKGPFDLGEDNYIISHFRITVVPEPASSGLLVLGLMGLLSGAKRRFHRDR